MDEQDLKEIVEDISFLVSVRDSAKLRNILYSTHPADIADILRSLPQDGRGYVFGLLDLPTASDVVVELDESSREQLLEEIDERRLAEMVDEMDSDDATDLIAELPPALAEKILRSIEPKDRQEVQELLRHEGDTAGGIMALEFIALDKDSTVDEAIHEIRRRAEEVGEIYDVYVVDTEGKLVGLLPLQRLILYSPHTRISEIMDQEVISVPVDTDQEQVANLVRHYNLVSVPVVDKQGKLVGRITIDDIVDVMEEEASEDILRMGGVGEEERVFTPPLQSVRRRLPWLYVNLVTAILAASVVSLFQGTIAKAVILAVFMPIVAGMGGNAGTQTLTVIVRSIALGELTLANARRALLKEILVGLGNGIGCGAVMSIVAYLWHGNPMLGVVLGSAMVINMFVAGLGGTIIPLALKWLKVDPALASGVFVTTLTDVFGFLSFLGLATLFITYLV